MRFSPHFSCPAYPAAWLLFGLLLTQAMAHFMAIPWPQWATVVVYTVASAWVTVLAWRGRRQVWPVTALDLLLIGFVLLVSVSLVFQGGIRGETGKFARYLPFMVVVPYLCGRLMRASDIALLMRAVLIAGITILPLLLIDRFTSPGRDVGRWPFLGLDHGALLVGSLLSIALVALCVVMLDFQNPSNEGNTRRLQSIRYCLIGLMTAFLVWLTARGFLLASLVGVAATSLSARHQSLWRRVGLLAAVLTVVGLSFFVLPKIDPYFGRMAAVPMDISSLAESVPAEAAPILGEASCKPFKEGANSVAMRWVLYQEAVAMFVAHPYWGVGSARFGVYSCTGPTGFPHSTILQGFAELGLVGGGLLVGLLVLATVKLVRSFLYGGQGSNWSEHAFVMALFATFLVEDQIYGNYFMSAGTWLMLGVAASMRVNSKHGSESRG